jgi:hypothetical protein
MWWLQVCYSEYNADIYMNLGALVEWSIMKLDLLHWDDGLELDFLHSSHARVELPSSHFPFSVPRKCSSYFPFKYQNLLLIVYLGF